MARTARAGLIIAIVCTAWGLAAAAETVVATHSVYAEFAQAIVGDTVDIETIIPSGFCPAHYDLTPGDLGAVLDASLILYSGFEAWIDTLVGAAASSPVVLQLSGTWNTPAAATAKVEAIRDALIGVYPESADLFTANAADYIAELDELEDDLLLQAAALGASSVPVVCMEWQASFVGWLGFEVAVSYGMPDYLSLQDLVQLAAEGQQANAELVIDNLQSGVDFGAKLAREVGAVHVVLSNFPGAMPNTGTVLDLFARNAGALFSAIEPLE